MPGLAKLPVSVFTERYATQKQNRSPFVQNATLFQDVVIRCVRYAFANFPAKIGRVFFSKGVALPFFWFRMVRHGYLYSPISWQEISKNGFQGLWMIHDEKKSPDVIVYYCHGGGFSMGSAYFYIEPLLALLTMLTTHYQNPAIFALDYALVPDATFPTQLLQTIVGYDHVLSLINYDASRVCVAGDSAGATLILSLLLHIAKHGGRNKRQPGYALLISPWATLVSDSNRDTLSDYISQETLQLYGRQYAGTQENLFDPLVSPGCCMDLVWWANAAPLKGAYFAYGSEEVLAPETRQLISRWKKSGVSIKFREEVGGIHAWVIASLFLEDDMDKRVKGMVELVKMVKKAIPPC